MFDNLVQRFKADDEAEKIFELLRKSPELERLEREADESRIQKIADLGLQREKIVEQRACVLPQLRAAVQKAEAEENALRAELAAVTRRRIDAELTRLGRSQEFSLKLSVIDGELSSLTPRPIIDFTNEMLRLLDRIRGEVVTERRPGPPHWITGKIHTSVLWTNKQSVDTALAYIRTSIDQAARLASQPHAAIVARLKELRAAVPDHKQYDKKSTERALDG